MEKAQSINLKPFKHEKDSERKWDLLRGLVLFKVAHGHPNKTKNAIKGKNCFILYLKLKRF